MRRKLLPIYHEDTDFLRTFFHANDPELVLTGYEGHTAMFQLRDRDGYRIGRLLFSNVWVLCTGTRREYYDNIQLYTEPELPADFLYLRENMPRNHYLVVLHSAMDEEDSTLPLIGGARRGFIICNDVTFEAETNPGR